MVRKTVLITGSSRGLGRSIALAFASKGHNIVLHGRDEERLNSVRQSIVSHNVDCRVVIGDITEDRTIDALTRCSDETNVDILINNAGIYLQKPVYEMSSSEFRKVIDINLVAPALLAKNIFELFKKKSSGMIININSMAGKKSSGMESAYCASKHGLRSFMEVFKLEALKYNVVIIDIFLGAMNTDMTAERRDHNGLIKTEEVAEFLCQISQDYVSMRINEIDIFRKLY